MNKSDLIEALAAKAHLPLKRAEFIVNHIFDVMTAAMVRGERIELRGFGSFQIKSYPGYSGRNPRTGNVVEVLPKKLPFFKVGKELKTRVDDGGRASVQDAPRSEPQAPPQAPEDR